MCFILPLPHPFACVLPTLTREEHCIMSIGTSVPLRAYTIDPAFMAKKAEELGFESIWYAEHPAVPVHSASPVRASSMSVTTKRVLTPWSLTSTLLTTPRERDQVPA
jgi:hypothetical protein